jgi:hypothetical protein
LFESITPLIIMCWVVSAGNTTSAPFYPGDAYVDWIGVDAFDPVLALGSPTATYTPFITWLAEQAFGVGKPVGIFATGVDNAEQAASVATWINMVDITVSTLGYSLWIWYNATGTAGNTVITPGSVGAGALANNGSNSVFNPPAVLPVGPPYQIGSESSSAASATMVIPVLAYNSGTNAIVVGATVNSATETVSSVADSKSNTYTLAVSNSGTAEYGNAMFLLCRR